MTRQLIMPTLILFFLPALAVAQGFTGDYALQSNDGTVAMSLEQDSSGTIRGTIKMEDGSVVTLEGEAKGSQAVGIATVGAKNLLFKLHFQASQLIFTLIPVTADNKPDTANAQEFPFSTHGAGDGATHSPKVRAGGLAQAEGGNNPLAGGAGNPARDPFAGSFSDGSMHLQLKGTGGRYQGQIQFQGKTFPVAAQSPDGGSLKGKFTSGTSSFDFTGKLEGSTLTFLTGGATYQLQSQGGAPAAPANPLGGGAARAATAAREGQAAQPIAGGQVVSDPSMGVRFSVPSGWKYEKRQAVYVMGHMTIPGMILVMPHTSNTIQELQAAASEPLYQADDGQLMVSGLPVILANNMIGADYGGQLQGKQAQGRIVGVVSPHGGGFLVMAGSDAAGYGPQHAQLAEGVARSMSFSKPQAPPEAAMWKQKLAGMRVKYFKHGGSSDIGGAYSWSDERDIDLCSDGAFQSTGGFQGSLGTANASAIMDPGRQAKSGQWAIVGQAGQPALQLRHTTGNVETYVLSADGTKTLLNGVRWYVIENPTCQ